MSSTTSGRMVSSMTPKSRRMKASMFRPTAPALLPDPGIHRGQGPPRPEPFHENEIGTDQGDYDPSGFAIHVLAVHRSVVPRSAD
jgi:hypothetical protein